MKGFGSGITGGGPKRSEPLAEPRIESSEARNRKIRKAEIRNKANSTKAPKLE